MSLTENNKRQAKLKPVFCYMGLGYAHCSFDWSNAMLALNGAIQILG